MNESQTPPKNIVLIGFMGSGKSTVGREAPSAVRLSSGGHGPRHRTARWKTDHLDLRGGRRRGVSNLETKLLEELNDPDAPRRIISTGGGVVGREENRRLLRHLGYVVWLSAPVQVILDRTGRNRDRPLLQTENPVERIESLMRLREPLYQESAHLKVETADLDCAEIATGILEVRATFHPPAVMVAAEQVKVWAAELGFDDCRIARRGRLPTRIFSASGSRRANMVKWPGWSGRPSAGATRAKF